MNKAERIVKKMLKTDTFSNWLGIEVITVESGYCQLQMIIRPDMVNGFDNVHGGITFSLADSALAFAANSHGKMSVALDCTISYPAAVKKGDVLTAIATEFSITNRTGVYTIEVVNQIEERVAFFKGTVYRMQKEWELERKS